MADSNADKDSESIVDRYINRPGGNTSGQTGNPGGSVGNAAGQPGNAQSSPGNADAPPTTADAPIEIGCLIALPASMAVMVDLRFRDGRRTAIPCGYITDLDYDPETGIVMATPTKTVAIAGRGLLPVYTAISTQTALAVCESPTGFDEGGGDPFVESITVTIAGSADESERRDPSRNP